MAFGNKYIAEFWSSFCDKSDERVLWRIEIAQRHYIGEVTEMKVDTGNEPLEIAWGESGDEPWQPIKGSEATLKVLSEVNFQYLELFTANPQEYRMTIYSNSQLRWRGFLVADTYSEGFSRPPYSVSIRATDGFGLLADKKFCDVDRAKFKGRFSLRELLAKVTDTMELDLATSDWIDISLVDGGHCLNDVYVSATMLYVTFGIDASFDDILKVILTGFGAQIFQSYGVLHIRRVVDLMNYRRPSSYFAHNQSRGIVSQMWDDVVLSSESQLEINPGVGRVVIESKSTCTENLSKVLELHDPESWVITGDNGTLRAIDMYRSEEDIVRKELYAYAIDSVAKKFWVEPNGEGKLQIKFTVGTTYPLFSASYTTVTLQYEIKLFVPESGKTYYLATNNEFEEGYNSFSLTATSFKSDGIRSLSFSLPYKGEITLRLYGNPSIKPFYLYDLEVTCEMLSEGENKGINIVCITNPKEVSSTIYIGDKEDFANAHLIQTAYLQYTDGSPTHTWIDGTTCASLEEVYIQTVSRLMNKAYKVLDADVMGSIELDLNDVVVDSRYTNSSFYLNRIVVSAESSMSKVEFIEFIEKPFTTTGGVDVKKIFDLGERVLSVITIGGFMIALLVSGSVVRYSLLDGQFIEIIESPQAVKLTAGEMNFCVLKGDIPFRTATAYNIDGIELGVIENCIDATYRLEEGLTSVYKNGDFYCIKPRWAEKYMLFDFSNMLPFLGNILYNDHRTFVCDKGDAYLIHDSRIIDRWDYVSYSHNLLLYRASVAVELVSNNDCALMPIRCGMPQPEAKKVIPSIDKCDAYGSTVCYSRGKELYLESPYTKELALYSDTLDSVDHIVYSGSVPYVIDNSGNLYRVYNNDLIQVYSLTHIKGELGPPLSTGKEYWTYDKLYQIKVSIQVPTEIKVISDDSVVSLSEDMTTSTRYLNTPGEYTIDVHTRGVDINGLLLLQPINDNTYKSKWVQFGDVPKFLPWFNNDFNNDFLWSK